MQRNSQLAVAKPPNTEWETRQTIEDLLQDARAIITLNSTDDNYRSVPVSDAVRILRIARNKLDRAVALAERYACEHNKFPEI